MEEKKSGVERAAEEESREELRRALSGLFHGAARKRFKRRETLIAEGEASSIVLLLEEGEAEVRASGPNGEEITLVVLRPGDTFGELGVLTRYPRSATVIGRTAGVAAILYRDAFLEALWRDPRASRALIIMLSRRLIRLTEQTRILGLKSGWRRVASALLFFHENPTYRPSELNASYISRFCGVSQRQTSRILRRFEKNGWVLLPSASCDITVTKPSALVDFLES
jgi:CRP/FNR family cyclic AMP-dependent transcriptional regulator